MPEIIRFVLRLPPDIHAALADWAKEEGRSLHGQILYLLRKLLEDRQKNS